METLGAATLWLVASLTVVAGCSLACLLLLSSRRKTSPATGLPLPPGRSFGFLRITESLDQLRALSRGELSNFVRIRTAQFGSKTFRTSIFFHPAVVVQGSAANRFIALAETKKQMLNAWPASSLEVLGEHIPPGMHGAAHRRLRQIVMSCVSPLALQKLVGKVDVMTQTHFQSFWNVRSQQVSLVTLIKNHAFSIACSLLAGVEEPELLAQLHHQFRIWTAGTTALPLDFPGTAFRKAKNAKKVLSREVSKLIDQKQEELQDGAQGRKGGAGKEEDMLGMLLRACDENGSFLNREELQDVMLFLLIAGNDTAAATLSFALKFLELNPACYDRLCEEHRAIASLKKPGETIEWTDIQNMKYTWAVLQETLRLRPVIYGGFKHVEEDVSFDGFRIPRGWRVVFTMSATHRDETFFQEASNFDPSRFYSNGKTYTPPPYVYVPFGIGPHSCPGGDFARMFMSMYLHHLALRQCKWQACDPNEQLSGVPLLGLAKGYKATICVGK